MHNLWPVGRAANHLLCRLASVPCIATGEKNYLIFIENDDNKMVLNICVYIFFPVRVRRFIHLGSFGSFSIINKHKNNKHGIMGLLAIDSFLKKNSPPNYSCRLLT